MRYIIIALLLGLSACVTTKYLRVGVEEPVGTEISNEAIAKIDRNHDGKVSSEELDVAVGNPSTLSAFIWLIITVLATIALTAIVSNHRNKVSLGNGNAESNTASPIYADKTRVANDKEKRHVIRG
jgi:hypothetical protein